MKQLQLLLIFTVGFIALSFGHNDKDDPVILKINDEGIHASEFLYIYTKNNPNPSFKKDSLDDYMELFINYKLKVKEAENLGYDTIPELQRELASYRKQLSMPYMIDKEQNEKLVEEAYDRIQNEISASHILVRVKGGSPKDTLQAYKKIMELRKRIVDGGEDFARVAAEGSEDPSAKSNKGYLGYFSALQMVYRFEEAAFNTEPGNVSMPIRTKFGYHIIKVHDKRKAKGKMKAAHIMIVANENMSKEDVKAAEEKINEIYQMLENGESFEELAKKHSDDRSSAAKGGLIPTFGAGAKQRMVPEFEEAAFDIEKDGEYSKPIQTPFGFHIIKRHELMPVPSYEDMYRELKMKVEKDIRAQTTKQSFIKKLKVEYDFNDEEAEALLPVFYENMGNEFYNGQWKGLPEDVDRDETLFSFNDIFFTVGDFEKHLLSIQNTRSKAPIKDYVLREFDAWATKKLVDYENKQLEKKYPEFKNLIKEYRDGILVFEIMQNEIWNKAAQDSVGIRNYYDKHQDEFTYPLRYKGVLYECKDKETADRVYDLVSTDTLSYGKIQNIVNEKSQLNVVVQKQNFSADGTDSFKKGKKTRKFKEGLNKVFEYEDEYYVFDVEEVLEPRNRKFEEAKGLVTAAYQNQLEKEWLKKLREKYTIEIQEDVLYNLKN